ncbi:MAG TPA: helix-turn-helix domain-containing protein [Candidatus Saccharimonadales bacterium]|nr:helix-turn-helix domain-containing protein [Candidatus Saccharimonadales bacterium]
MDTIPKAKTDAAWPECYICPVENTLEILDGKWKILILHYLLEEGTLRFSELKKRLPSVTQKMLTAQLRSLEKRNVVARKVYPVVPPKVEYSLTATGLTLRPIMQAMREWSIAYDKVIR